VGRIVRGARISEQSYVVEVPEAVVETPPLDLEDDVRFAQHYDAPDFDESDAFFDARAATEPAPPPVDVEQVRADARKLIDTAQADAEAILRRAAMQARELVAKAEARSSEIEAQARSDGHAEGVTDGRAAVSAEFAESVAAMHELVAAVRAERNEVIESAEPELVNLAMAIAERVVHEHIAVSPDTVLENVRSALTRLVGREVVTLRVNPADVEIIRQHRDAIASGNDVEHVRVVEDQRVDRGGVVVETDAGTIDAKISTQLREARRALQSGEVAAREAPAQAS